MTVQDLMINYDLNRGDAEIVYEYLRELGHDVDEDVLPLVINSVQKRVEALKSRYDNFNTEQMQRVYEGFPSVIKEGYGDNYIMGYVNTLAGKRIL